VWGVGCEFSPGKSLNPTRFSDLFSQPYLGLAEKVGAKHSDRKSTVSAIGYCPNASPLQILFEDLPGRQPLKMQGF